MNPQTPLFGGISGTPGNATPSFGAASAPSQPPAQSLFGGTPNPNLLAPPQPAGMFGSPSANKTSGLFAPTTSTQGSSIFSNSGSTAVPMTGGSSLFGGSATGGMFGSTGTGGMFGGTGGMFGGATLGSGSMLSSTGGMLGQPNAMVAPTTYLTRASQLPPPTVPANDSSQLLATFKNPAGFSENLLKNFNLQELTTPPQIPEHELKRPKITTKPFAVPLEKWRPMSPLTRHSSEQKMTRNLLDITTPKQPKLSQKQAVVAGRVSFHEWLSSPRLPSDVLEMLTVTVKGLPGGPISLPLRGTVFALQKKVSAILKDIEPERLRLWYKGKVLDSGDPLSIISPDSELLYVVDSKRKAGMCFLAPEESIPTLTRPEYTTSPSITDLARMSSEELRTVENFTIQNEHGSVEFPGRSDLTGLNLDKIIQIRRDSVVIYPEGCVKPKPGFGLNRKAKITIFNRFPKTPSQSSQFEDKLRKICLRERTNFHSYDQESGHWVFTTNPL